MRPDRCVALGPAQHLAIRRRRHPALARGGAGGARDRCQARRAGGLAREALSLYRPEAATDGADGARGIEFMTDKRLRCGPTLIAAWHGRKSRTWEYPFSHGYEPLGAVHLWDQQYVFGIMVPPADQPADRALSEAIEHYWTNFAKTGDPNGGGLPAWPEVGAPGRLSRLHDSGADPRDRIAPTSLRAFPPTYRL